MASDSVQLAASASPHLVVQVAVPVPQQRGEVLVYDYLAGPAAAAPVGSIVQIPLGSRQVWGLILGKAETSTLASEKLKSVIMLADIPPLTTDILHF